MERRTALTLRVPSELLAEAKEVCGERESLNDLIVAALDREVRRRQGLALYKDIVRLSDEIYTRGGLQPDSTPMIRAMREGDPRDG